MQGKVSGTREVANLRLFVRLVVLDKQGWRLDYWAGHCIQMKLPVETVGQPLFSLSRYIVCRYKAWLSSRVSERGIQWQFKGKLRVRECCICCHNHTQKKLFATRRWQMVAASCFTNGCRSQIANNFASPTKLSQVWALVLICETCQIEREQTISCCKSQLANLVKWVPGLCCKAAFNAVAATADLGDWVGE